MHRFALFLAAALGSSSAWGQAQSAAPPVQSSKTAKRDESGLLGGKWYGTAEIRHHLNTYYDDHGTYQRQEPSMHVRLQTGAQFYEGIVDAYATLGVYKMSDTQQILQRRPELGLDFHIVKNDWFDVIEYNLVQMPYRETAVDPETDEGGEMGTVAMLGFAPAAKLPLSGLGAKWELKVGEDGWTKVYSKRQYTGSYRETDRDYDQNGHGGLSLTDGSSQTPIEDTAMHYRLVSAAGVTAAANALPALVTEVSVNHYTKFDPRYSREGSNGSVDYKYGTDRISYYRWRLQYQVSDRWSITNDFYQFYEEFFAARRIGLEDRRFRNVARVSCKL